MKVVIVTYYWPPAGGPGVQRWLKFVKYLRNFGIEPVVFTADNPYYPTIDASLAEDVPEGIEIIKCPIFEPNNIVAKLKKSEAQKSAGFLDPNPSFFAKVLLYIRANYFIPDARMFWVKPSVKKLKKYISEENIDLVITTGPPHSLHLIGKKLKEQLGVKWLADFRDPWTSIDYFHLLPLTKSARKKHFRMEEEVVRSADSVLMVSNHAQEKYKEFAKEINVITNGFDTEVSLEDEEITIDTKFSITHIGSMNSERNPKILWETLSELCKEDAVFAEDLELKLIGKLDDTIWNEEIAPRNFKNVARIPYVPHTAAKKYQRQAQVLLIVVNDYPSAKEMIPGKTFECLQAQRPILAFAPEDGDLSAILEETTAGVAIDFSNKEKVREEILKLYAEYKKGSLQVNIRNLDTYHRKNLTEKLSIIIKDLIQK
ncbi:glycosyltransferase family 4 protein [Tenacibaculum sp. M341]|uniref:glycosyltransferase family 4 protein n=1 Tax=Tenacibaculum sp. M341 TaxID=2530339 RepID=UPI0010522C1E|nr:glycosyltransferase family 4 protein [Tenacibaculum sp. M341]TCI90308.1 glycosyl transferase family 1 [Tenacibaculum sp. M341]